MMNWKFSANAGFFGLRRDRFTQYQPPRTLEEKFALIASIPELTGIELKYPAEFQDSALVKRLLDQHGLALSAISVDLKDATRFRYGALSARDAEARQHAVILLREAMDLAAELRVELVTTCPLADGHDYPFQVDFATAWGNLIETVRAAATYRSDIKLSLEYQPHEPHAYIMLDNVAKVLHVCTQVGVPNLGANLDVGHSFAAHESPAEAATLLASQGRLFYVHTNDNTGDGGDWDMISGSIHFWHWLEFLYTLERIGYTGWLGGDIVPKHIGPDAAYRTNLLMVQRMSEFLQRADPKKLEAIVKQDGNTAEVYDYLSQFLIRATSQ